jgi:hypothetical protein
MTSIKEYFHLRDDFQTFKLEPDIHSFLLFGKSDRAQRDYLLNNLEEASYSLEGYKGVVLGDYGRGKTHQSKNLIQEIKRKNLNLFPVYIKCSEYKAKESFSTFFKDLILSIPTEKLYNMAVAYERLFTNKEKEDIQNIIDDYDITSVFRKGLISPNPDVVRNCMRWLGGETKIDMKQVSGSLPLNLTLSKQFGSVMRGIAHLFKETEGTVPVFLIDEAQRFELINNTDAYWSWMANLRELTEVPGASFIFFIGASSQDSIPAIFINDEIKTRIGVGHYVEFFNPNKEGIKEFMLELFSVLIKKGPMTEPFRSVLKDKIGSDIDAPIPEDLKKLIDEENESLDLYPFRKESFEKFIDDCMLSTLSNKPREVLIRIQNAASRAIRTHSNFIDNKILDEIYPDGI